MLTKEDKLRATTFQISEADKDVLRTLAERDQRSMAFVLRKLIREAGSRRRVQVSEMREGKDEQYVS